MFYVFPMFCHLFLFQITFVKYGTCPNNTSALSTTDIKWFGAELITNIFYKIEKALIILLLALFPNVRGT
jgi:hypothetical protein